MTKRVFNFNPGPSTLPLEVLEIVRGELLDYQGTGMSIMESSHRSPQYDEINDKAIDLTKELMGIGDDYHVLFVGGGASTQFAHIPINFLHKGKTAAYVDTGTWSTKAIKEAQNLGNMYLAGSSKEDGYNYIPKDIDFPSDAAYLHVTSNNTIKGTQYHNFPSTGNVPLICDMSSDILSKELDYSQFSMVYAGAQKNLGPSGVTMVVVHQSLLDTIQDGVPTMFDYRTHASKRSLFNTPPAFGVYVIKLVLEWIKGQGGLKGIQEINRKKKDAVYSLIDSDPEFFTGTAVKADRSWMNITLRLPSEDLEKKLISEAKDAGFIGLKGHRSVGGVRISIYNAMPLEGAEKVAQFLADFRKRN